MEDALVKVSAVASTLATGLGARHDRRLIAGERDPQVLASLARGRMKAKHTALAEALTGMFEDHHGELAGLLLEQIAFCDSGSASSPGASATISPRSGTPGASTPAAPPGPRRAGH